MKKFKRLCVFALLCALLCAFQLTAAAGGGVRCTGTAQSFVLLSDGDLFTEFKNVMPGDSIQDSIEIKNSAENGKAVRIYLRALPHSDENLPLSAQDTEKMNAFLSRLTLSVKNGENEIFNASPDKAAGLSENVLIGSLKAGESAVLRLTLSVPLSLGNEFADCAGEVDWVFTAEELSEELPPTTDGQDIPVITDNPNTGDNSGILFYSLILLFGVALALAVIVFGRKAKKQRN